MSSILRALKKLDEDALPLENQAGEPQSNLRQMVNRRARGPRFRNRIFFFSLSVLAVIIVAAAALILFKPHPAPEPGNIMAKKHPEPKPKSKLNPKPDLQAEPALKPEQKSEMKSEQKPVPKPEPRTEPVQSPTPETKLHRIMGQHEIKPEPAPIPGKTISPTQPARPQLTLHGILWSDKKDRRVALIDEKYLKEGDTINGATIVKIDKKSVSLQIGEDVWTIRVK